jgi:hypothetical protein
LLSRIWPRLTGLPAPSRAGIALESRDVMRNTEGRRAPSRAIVALAASIIGALALAACGGGSGAGDAGAHCEHSHQCPQSPGHVCLDGRCEVLCDEAAGEHVCNHLGASDFPPRCCGANQMCCPVGYETDDCYTTCPRVVVCPRTDWPLSDVCLDSYCLYTAPPPADAGVADHDAGVADHDAGAPACVPRAYDSSCIKNCPEEQRCGDFECCGAGTRCQQGCCVPDTDPA